MRMIDKTTKIPDGSMPSERDAEGNLYYFVLAQFGRAAIDVGTPDRGQNDERTVAVDAIANILHWLNLLEIDPAPVLESASRHFLAEIPSQTTESRAVDILKQAGLDAFLEHTGGGTWVAEVRSETIEGRTVWVSDSEAAEGGQFLVGAYPEPWGDEWIEALSGPCSAEDLTAHVRRGLGDPGGAPLQPSHQEQFDTALADFKLAAMRLNQAWAPDQQVEDYPEYLPDFSEFALEVQAIERS